MSSEWPRAVSLSIPELLRALNQARVEYVVIGGYALAAHRYVRGTDDLDIVPSPTRANLKRLLKVVEAIDGEPVEIAGGLRSDELPVPFLTRGAFLGCRFAAPASRPA